MTPGVDYIDSYPKVVQRLLSTYADEEDFAEETSDVKTTSQKDNETEMDYGLCLRAKAVRFGDAFRPFAHLSIC